MSEFLIQKCLHTHTHTNNTLETGVRGALGQKWLTLGRQGTHLYEETYIENEHINTCGSWSPSTKVAATSGAPRDTKG